MARPIFRHPDKVRPVPSGPGRIDRRLVAGNKPLVGVDPLVGDGRYLRGVFQYPGDVVFGDLGKVIFVVDIEESVSLALEKRLVDMHAAAVDAEGRLGHEGGIDAVSKGNLLDHQAIGHHVIGHGHGICIPHIYLMLAGGYLVMGILNAYAQ